MSKKPETEVVEPVTVNGDKKRQRSPNYPAVGLRNAVERAKKLYDADGKPGSAPAAAYGHIGFTGAHGQAQAVLSALKKFGLLEDKDGRVVPTKQAIDVFEFPKEHERHKAALREMALKPAIYLELVKKFKEHSRLPSDASLKPELISDKGFNPKAVDGFLKDFRDSLTFAGLLSGVDLNLSGVPISPAKPAGGDDKKEDGDEAVVTEDSNTPKPRVERRKMTAGTNEDVYTLTEGDVVLQWPSSIGQDSLAEVEDWLKLMLRKLKRVVESAKTEAAASESGSDDE